eukprot:2217597-Pyramimonas_sp.AAC.1
MIVLYGGRRRRGVNRTSLCQILAGIYSHAMHGLNEQILGLIIRTLRRLRCRSRVGLHPSRDYAMRGINARKLGGMRCKSDSALADLGWISLERKARSQ